MGVDLRLLPVESDGGDFGFSHSILALDRDREWFALLLAKQETSRTEAWSHPPKRFFCYTAYMENGEPGYGEKAKDAYGFALRCLRASDILAASRGAATDRNRAVLSYLAVLPADTRVILDWH